MNPSLLGEMGNMVTACFDYSTSTARLFVRTSDTGSVLTTGRAIDLSKALHLSNTGGKPLDATFHTRKSGPPMWRSLKVSVPVELVFHTSGINAYVEVAHKTRAATSGAGSTWRALKTEVFRYKAGTDTDVTYLCPGVVSSVNLQAADRYVKSNVRFFFRKATDTAAKDTTTSTEFKATSAVYELNGGEAPQISIPFKVS